MTPRKPTRAKQLGVNIDQYESMLAAQGGHCALCPSTPKTRRLHVDHNHATGEVRGLLCYVCNKYLPASRDAEWHRRAADFLDADVQAEVLRRFTETGHLATHNTRGSTAAWRAAMEKGKP